MYELYQLPQIVFLFKLNQIILSVCNAFVIWESLLFRRMFHYSCYVGSILPPLPFLENKNKIKKKPNINIDDFDSLLEVCMSLAILTCYHVIVLSMMFLVLVYFILFWNFYCSHAFAVYYWWCRTCRYCYFSYITVLPAIESCEWK